jgi:RNA polymerase sigma factor (sigma-70 family)
MFLYKPLEHRLSAYCRVVTGSEEKAFDLIQDTLTAAFVSFEKLREPNSFLFFLFGIARNCHFKQQRRWKYFGKQSDIKPANIVVTSDSIEMQYDLDLIYKSISKLNDEQREAVLMFHILGFSTSDCAKNLNISEAAVKNRLARGRENLRKLISDKESSMLNSISANKTNTLTK